MRPLSLLAAAIAALSTGMACAAAPAYPTKPVRMVVISPPGGTTDILSRAFANYMGDGLGQQVVTDNRPGGGGIIAAEIVARSAPDGHTLLYTHTSHSVLPSLHAKLPYDTIRDFQPVALVAIFPGVLVVNNQLPVKSVKELIALARAKPGQLNYATGTTGATAHLSGELFKAMAKIDVVQVPYKGTATQLTAVIAGESQFTFASLPAAMPLVQSNRVRAIAVGSARRTPALPDLPTIAETVLPGFDVSAWNAVFAPKGTPRPVVERIRKEFARIIVLPDMKERAAGQGAELMASTPEELAHHLRTQIDKWAPIVKAAGIKPD